MTSIDDVKKRTHTCAWCHLPVIEEHCVKVEKPQKYPEFYCFRCWFGDLYKEELEKQKWLKKKGGKHG